MNAAKRIRVLVTDGDTRTALACVRSLVAAGHEVWALASAFPSLAGVSRGVRPVVVAASALEDARAYTLEVSAFCVQRRIDVLLPVTDAAVNALLQHRALLPPSVALPLPSLAQFRAGADKARMLEHARRAGFAVPASLSIDSLDDAEEAIVSATFPAILKPHRSVVTAPGGRAIKLDVAFVADSAACRAAVRALPHEAFPVLLQERIYGPAEGLFSLRWNGAPVASFAHRRLREKPPAGGVSVYRESIAADAALVAATDALLAALDWKGVAMVECKVDRRTGRHVFMELNGRLWGSLQLAIDAGVDFPALLVACATGADAAPSAPYVVGVRSRWFWGDVDHLYARLVKSAAEMHLEEPAPSRLQVITDFLRVPFSGDRAEVGRLSDPLPSLLEGLRRLVPDRSTLRALVRLATDPARHRASHAAHHEATPSAPTPAAAHASDPSPGPSRRRTRTRVPGG